MSACNIMKCTIYMYYPKTKVIIMDIHVATNHLYYNQLEWTYDSSRFPCVGPAHGSISVTIVTYSLKLIFHMLGSTGGFLNVLKFLPKYHPPAELFRPLYLLLYMSTVWE